jgi:hypothetical protein
MIAFDELGVDGSRRTADLKFSSWRNEVVGRSGGVAVSIGPNKSPETSET